MIEEKTSDKSQLNQNLQYILEEPIHSVFDQPDSKSNYFKVFNYIQGADRGNRKGNISEVHHSALALEVDIAKYTDDVKTRYKEKLKEELWEYYTREDKDDLLDHLVDASLAHPDGIIKEKIYPEVGGKEKLEQRKQNNNK